MCQARRCKVWHHRLPAAVYYRTIAYCTFCAQKSYLECRPLLLKVLRLPTRRCTSLGPVPSRLSYVWIQQALRTGMTIDCMSQIDWWVRRKPGDLCTAASAIFAFRCSGLHRALNSFSVTLGYTSCRTDAAAAAHSLWSVNTVDGESSPPPPKKVKFIRGGILKQCPLMKSKQARATRRHPFARDVC